MMILKKCDLPVAPDTLPMLVADRVAMARSMKIGGDMIVSVNENEFICLTQSLRFDSSTWQKWEKIQIEKLDPTTTTTRD